MSKSQGKKIDLLESQLSKSLKCGVEFTAKIHVFSHYSGKMQCTDWVDAKKQMIKKEISSISILALEETHKNSRFAGHHSR